MDVDVLDAEFLGMFEVPLRPGVMQLVAAAIAPPLGCVELHALELVLPDQRFESIEPTLAIARVENAVQDEAVRVFLLQHGVLLGAVEAVLVEIAQYRWLEDRHVIRPIDEQVAVHGFWTILVEL